MDVEQDDVKFLSKLDEKSKQRAKEELNERNDKDTKLAVQSFRQWILEQDWLKTPIDFAFLLRFLRARKFSQLGARERLENFWTVRTKCPSWCKNVDPADKIIQEILQHGIFLCPRGYDSEGRRLIIERTSRLDINEVQKRWGLENVFKVMILVADWLCYDENVQVNGIQKLIDCTNSTITTATTLFTGENGKNLVKYLQHSQPARVKSLNMYKEPSFVDAILAIVKPLMAEKMRSRLMFHGNSMVSVYKVIDKSLLPTEYLPDDYTGPSSGSNQNVIDDMIKDMMTTEFRSYIQDLSSDKYGIDLTKRKQNDEQPAESYRKLHAE